MIYVLDINGKIKVTLTGGGGGVATAANQTDGSQKTQIVDAGGEVATITGGKLDVNATVTPSGTQDVNVVSTISLPVTGTFWQATQPISAAALPLPSGAATSANQQTDALTDTELRATPVPVSGTVTANTGLSQPLTDTQLRATPVPVSGTVTVDTSLLATAAKQDDQTALLTTIDGDTSNLDVALSTRLKAADTLAAVTTVGTVTAVTAITNALPAGTNAIGKLAANSGVDIGDVDVTSVSGNVTVIQGTATNLKTQSETYQGGAAVASGNPLQVTLANTGSNSTAVKVDGSAVTQPVSMATNTPVGSVAHDGIGTGVNPILIGGYSSAAAPTSVNADGDATRIWLLRNGAQATVLTAAGALIGGDAANGLDVDVTRMAALVAGSAVIGKVGIDQTTPGTTNLVALTAETTKAIGVVRNSDGSGNLLTSNSSTYTAKIALDINVLGTLGTAFSTAGKVDVKSTQKPSIGSTTVMTVTNLQSKANSATVGWQSARVSNLSTLATDYEIFVKLTTANTAPANDKSAYVWLCPWYTSDGGSTWFAASGGTTTLPSGSEGSYTIATPHNFRLLGILNYTTQQMVMQDVFLLSNAFGNRPPDGFSIIIINYTGAALSTSCIVDYTPLNDALV